MHIHPSPIRSNFIIRLCHVLTLIFLIPASDSPAQHTADTFRLMQATIPTLRIPASTPLASVIRKEELKRLPGATVAQWLTFQEGIDIRQRGPEGVQADVGIRGGSFDQTLLLLNGMKISDPQTGHHLLNLPLPESAIDRIEIFRNSASRLYGINALCGAINLVTKVPEGNQLFLGAEGGDFMLHGLSGGLSSHHDKYSQFTSASYRASGGYLPNTDFRVIQAFHQSNLKIKNIDLDLVSGYSDRSFGARGFYVPNPEEYESVQTVFNGLRMRHQGKRLRLTAQTYHRYNQDHYIYIRSKPEIYQNRHYSHTGAMEIHAAYRSFLGETGVGIDSRTERIESSNLGTRERNILGMYAEHAFRHRRLMINPGVYANLVIPEMVHFFPGLDISYQSRKRLNLHASVSRGMRLPTYTDLYYQGPNNTGNPDLRPETATSAEAGIQKGGRKGLISFKGFYRHSDNLIDWARMHASLKWQPLNLNIVDIFGTETSVDLLLKGILQRFRISHTFMRSEATVSDFLISRYALSNLRHQAIAVLIIEWRKGLTQTITLRHLNRVGYKDYTVMDSKLLYQVKSFRVWAQAANLTNTDYIEAGYVTMPGRWFRMGLSCEIGLKKRN